MKKHSPPTHILVAVSGNTPQIVTETLYVLMVKSQPAVPISSVFIITTAKGAETAWSTLGGKHGAIAQFSSEYGIDPRTIKFEQEQILVIRGAKTSKGKRDRTAKSHLGEPLEDIRTSSDNRALASQLLGFIKQLTQDENTVLHCSMGGGRRTMSAFMLTAMTLYGREQDQLTHVLVPKEFESNSKFFFPPKTDTLLPVRRGDELEIVSTADARIELADIPFVRLRPLLGKHMTKVEHSWEELLEFAQRRIDLDLSKPQPPMLVISLEKRSAWFGDQPIKLPAAPLALLMYYADIKANHCVEPSLSECGQCTACFQQAGQLDIARYRELYSRLFPYTSHALQERKSLGIEYSKNVMTYNTRIKRATKDPSLSVVSVRAQYGHTFYGLALDKNRIRINE
jgi:CRISPR-associated protein (TIGR02584 family)